MWKVVHPQAVCALVLLAVGLTQGQRPPPNYSPDALPDTSFSCRGRVPGGYYADVEAGCQMFHVCGASEATSFRFLCPNDTVFDQQNLICANWFQVVCEYATVQYARNFEIFKTDSNEETSFNTLYEDNLPSLDDYEYESGFGDSIGFGATRAPVLRATIADNSVEQFDQYVAASTARPFVSPASNTVGLRRGSTFVQSSTTEAARFPPRQNALNRATGRRLSSAERRVKSKGRFSSPVSEPTIEPSLTFDSTRDQSSQEASATQTTTVPSRVAPTSASAGSQTFQRTFNRIASSPASAERPDDVNTNEIPLTDSVDDVLFTANRPVATSTPLPESTTLPDPVFVTFSAPFEPESEPGAADEPAPTVSQVARSFFGPNVLPEVTARPVQALIRRGNVVRQKAAVAASGRSQARTDSSVAATTFRPRAPITPTPRTATGGETGARVSTEASTERETEVITETRRRTSTKQSSETNALAGRRRGSRRRGGAARRGSAGASPARPRTTVATPGRTSPAAGRTVAATATARPRAASGRRGRGGRRFNPAVPGGALKQVQQWRQKVARFSTAEQSVQQNSVGVDLPQSQQGVDGKTTGDAVRGGSNSADQPGSVSVQGSSAASVSRRVNDGSFSSRRRPFAVRQTTELSPVAVDSNTATSVSRLAARVITETTPASVASPLPEPSGTATEASATTPLIIRKRIRVRGRPSRRPVTTPRSTPAVVLPTNKEASSGSRLLRRPKLPLSSALPAAGRSRRLQDSGAREARSGATRLVAPPRGRFGRQPAAAAAPVTYARRQSASREAKDYDYEYYDDESDVVFRKLAEANELLLDGLTRVHKLN